jgi:queuosine precursor transporter
MLIGAFCPELWGNLPSDSANGEGLRADNWRMTSSARHTYLLTIYVTLVVTALAGGGKLTHVGPLTMTATVMIYGLANMVVDLYNELYGKAAARQLVTVGLLAMMTATVCFQVVVWTPAVTDSGPAYERVLGATPRLVAAGFAANLVCQFLDVAIFASLRRVTTGRFLWLRSSVSTIGSQLINTITFVGVGFGGVATAPWKLVAGQFLAKAALAVVYTPLLYVAVTVLRRMDAAERVPSILELEVSHTGAA